MGNQNKTNYILSSYFFHVILSNTNNFLTDLQGVEAKLGIFLYNNKRPFSKTRLILIQKRQQNKKIDTTQ